MKRGGTRNPKQVPAEDRDCPIHGKGEHRCYTYNHTVSWRCVRCTNEKSARHYEAIKTGAHTVIPVDFSGVDGDDACKHRWQLDDATSQDWGDAWRCPRCGTTTMTLPGQRP